MTEPILRVDGVEKSFTQMRAVKGVSFDLRPGELVALLGPNGAGKTTLLRMIIGILKPDRGRIEYRLHGAASEAVDRRRIGYLPEERGLYTDTPVMRSLVYFAALRGMPRAQAVQEAARWLERMGLGARAGEQIRNLSKGNQQKVQFIASVVHRPALAILDEPFSGLDPLNQDFFLDLIRELRAQGTTILFSAHQMQLVERLADRVVMIRGGQVAMRGTLDEVRHSWGAGRRLRIRLGGNPDVEPLRALPAVRDLQPLPSGEIEISFSGDAGLNDMLQALSRFEVLDLRTEEVTLHDIYVRTVGGDPVQEAAA